jgi:hypothetical protein
MAWYIEVESLDGWEPLLDSNPPFNSFARALIEAQRRIDLDGWDPSEFRFVEKAFGAEVRVEYGDDIRDQFTVYDASKKKQVNYMNNAEEWS